VEGKGRKGRDMTQWWRGEERRDMRSIRWKGRKGHDKVVARRGEEGHEEH
jgi:hypothetical protein